MENKQINPSLTGKNKQPYVVEMSTAEFIDMQDNPQQRDTELRADRAKDNHLSTMAPTHAMAAAAKLPDGTMIKLDGHTRSYLWAKGELEKPPKMHDSVYPVDDMSGAIRVYELFDNSTAVKTAADLVQSAYKLNGLNLSSNLLRSGVGMERVFRFAYGLEHGRLVAIPKSEIALVDLVKHYSEVLKTLDTIDVSKSVLPAPYMVAAIVALKRDGQKAETFICAVKEKIGINNAGDMDAIHVVNSYISSAEYTNLRLKRSAGAAKMCVPEAVFLHAYSAWEVDSDSAWFSVYPKRTKFLMQFFNDK